MYVCDFIFKQYLGINYILTDKAPLQDEMPCAILNYSNRQMKKCIHIQPDSILFEKGITSLKPTLSNQNGEFKLFPNDGDLGFDIFAAVFYMISRYEEWQDFQADEHGRFELSQSILFKNKMHLRPVVDEWIELLKIKIKEKFNAVLFPPKNFRTLATIDVDNLFAYKHKGLSRTLGAGIKDLLRFNFKNIQRRNSVINDIEPDPFDIYDHFSLFCKEHKIPLIYFILFSNSAAHDRTIDPSSEIFPITIDRVRKHRAFVGLHPGYNSKNSELVFKKEYNAFVKAAKEKIEFTRQHYLRFNIKETPFLLMQNEINADFSMGFASGPGFRAGTSEAFFYYDFLKEESRDFILVPFCAMDGAYFVYQNIQAEKALEDLLKLKENVRKVGGLFTTVFHERTFDEQLYPGYGEMYKQLLLS